MHLYVSTGHFSNHETSKHGFLTGQKADCVYIYIRTCARMVVGVLEPCYLQLGFVAMVFLL